MNSIQAEKLLRVIDTLEQEGCKHIEVRDFWDRDAGVTIIVYFEIPAEPGDSADEVKQSK
ncbi:MAG: hypothetical protein JRE40_01455 [Deltaproteobacteria bacterium]|nr:hypothetical protein [Deltaproteobacteria bacterium]